VELEAYGSGRCGFVAVLRGLRRRSLFRFSLLIVALAMASIGSGAAAHAQGQRPTEQQIRQMFPSRHNLIPDPPEGYKLPFYRWREGTPIDVFIVTDEQRGPCADAIKNVVQRQIGSIRQEVPALRNIRDPKMTDWIPEEMPRAAILIGLDTDNPRIGPAMAKYTSEIKGKAKVTIVDSSIAGDRGYRGSNDSPDAEPIYATYHQDGLAIEQDHIVHAYAWSVHLRGLRIYSQAECRDFYWDDDLNRILGGEHFVPGYATGWLTNVAPPEKQKWHSMAHRLFLKALYSCPGSPVQQECVEASLIDLWNRLEIRKSD
jgi:hypothetical protein